MISNLCVFTFLWKYLQSEIKCTDSLSLLIRDILHGDGNPQVKNPCPRVHTIGYHDMARRTFTRRETKVTLQYLPQRSSSVVSVVPMAPRAKNTRLAANATLAQVAPLPLRHIPAVFFQECYSSAWPGKQCTLHNVLSKLNTSKTLSRMAEITTTVLRCHRTRVVAVEKVTLQFCDFSH